MSLARKVLITLTATAFAFAVNNVALAKQTSNSKRFSVTSEDYSPQRIISSKNVWDDFGCTGKNISPDITISNVPLEAKSLAITIYDPDAPTGSGFWHWVVYDISPETTKIESGGTSLKRSEAQFAVNDGGIKHYVGACPPKGEKHKYIITIHALDVEKLRVTKNTNAVTRFMIEMHTIAKASTYSFYER